MANFHLALEGVSYALPDGTSLFSDLNDTFDLRHTGLVGRNGVGKSVLARILAGQVTPSQGRRVAAGSVHYLAQQVDAVADDATVADLAGVQRVLAALRRIEAGSAAHEDYDAVGDRWDVARQLRRALEQHGLAHLDAQTPAHLLSGGERTRVALIGALLSDADFLILDEPTNHLDQPSRQALITQLAQWPRGLLVISHDRKLLDTMDRIVELSPLGLHSHGGNYAFYARAKAHEQQRAVAELERAKWDRQREARALQEQRERQEKRQARGTRSGKEANQAKILLGRQKARSEQSTGKLRKQHAAAQLELTQRVHEAAQQVDEGLSIHLHAGLDAGVAQRQVAMLDAVELPFVPAANRRLSLQVRGQQRIGVIGPNGSGKSTLLKVLAGQLAPRAGTCTVTPARVYLDQALGNLDPARSVLAQASEANRLLSEGELRMRLAQLGLDADKVTVPSSLLSGGERLKAALACVLYADPPPQLLLLDEPSNHLDLPSLQALETMLSRYPGAMLVASHDTAFLDNLALTDQLVATADGWRLLGVGQGRDWKQSQQ